MAVSIRSMIQIRRYSRLVALPKHRMGSFSSAPKILNPDVLDGDVDFAGSISRHELLQYCQKQYQSYPMVKRSFKRHNSEDSFSTVGFKARKLNGISKGCSEYLSNPNSIRVFQWNILSQSLGQCNDNFARCPTKALDWHNRRFHIIEEIIEYCPDVICLQEVDHFNFLRHILNTQGYVGMFFPKPDSPCLYIDGNNGPDGCAIFYRKNKFDFISSKTRVLEIWRVQSNQVALMVILRLQETGQEVCIMTTHLKARKGALLATLRNEQGRDLLQFLSSHCGDRPVIMCGDFNAEPVEPIYTTITKNNTLRLSSAYADCDETGNEPAYTTWKIRDEGEICHTIDYIFYTKDKMEVESVLEFPTAQEIGTDRVPSYNYPSDHFSLVSDFKLI